MEPAYCPQCRAPLVAGADGKAPCEACLMKLGMQSWESLQNGDSSRLAEVTDWAGQVEAAPPAPAELARHFPQLEILELIGSGGMGAVYKARQRSLDRLVALKIIQPHIGREPAFAARFAREARALAKLNHPHIVGIHDFGEVDGLYYLIMEYVDGTNLRSLIRQGDLKPSEAVAIVPQICEALEFAHESGVVHRDIKPENILVDRRGQVRIADFGLAKLLGQGPTAGGFLTGSRQVMGTMHYMAPEQLEHPQDVDHRADIYALGVVFYELLTGQLPLGRFEPPSQRVRLDVRLDEVVLKALERSPQRRYQQVVDVRTDLERVEGRPRAARAGHYAQTAPASWSADGGSRHQLPAVLLILAAGIGLLASVFDVALITWNLSPRWDDVGVPLLLLSLLSAPLNLLALFAGTSMLQGRHWGLAVTGAAIVVLPLHLAGLLTVPIGIYCLATLLGRDMRRLFLETGPVARPAGGPERMAWQLLGVGQLTIAGLQLATGSFLAIWWFATEPALRDAAETLLAVHCITSFMISPVLIASSVRLLRGRRSPLCGVSCVLVMLPVNACFLLGLPVGLLGLATLAWWRGREPGSDRHPLSLDEAERQAKRFAVIAFVAAGLLAAEAVFWATGATVTFFTARRDEHIFAGLAFAGLTAVCLLLAAVQIRGAIAARRQRGLAWCYAAAIIALIPAPPVALVSIPLGILALGTLSEARLAFSVPPAKPILGAD